MDDITKKRVGPAVEAYAEHMAHGLDAFVTASAHLPKGLDPDAWAISRGMKESGLPWLFVAGFALAHAQNEGLPSSDVVEYIRKLMDLVVAAGAGVDPPPPAQPTKA